MNNIRNMWSKEQQPNEETRYNHMLLISPLGVFTLEWKGWKEFDSICGYLNGEYLDSFDCLEDATEYVEWFLRSRLEQLMGFLS